MIKHLPFALFCLLAFTRLYAGESPNVVLILTDDQGWGDLSLSGNPDLSTPNIDSLARDGVVFDRFFVCPVCSPTRAELLTGRFHQRSGVFSTSAGGERMNLDEATLAEAFLAGGYATGAFGKWHNGMQGPYHPNSRGFQEFYGFCSGHWGNYFSPMLEHNGEIVQGKGFIIDDLTDRAMAFIESNRNKKFFAYLPYNTPHSPMQVPDQDWSRFKDRPLKHVDKKDAHTRAALAMCENIDRNVGRVLQKLDELKLADNTLVLYFSDNGPNGHRWQGGMRGKKGSTDEGGVRSPLVMRWPNHIQPGTKITPITSVVDLMPTLLETCNLKAPGTKKLDGHSLTALLEGRKPVWKNRVIINSWNRSFSARSETFRLDHKGRLYDMVADPNQKVDATKQHPEIAANLKQAVRAFKQEASIKKKDRPFFITHPSSRIIQIPARDATPTGQIKRSNRYPNCTYMTHWVKQTDHLKWPAHSAAAGTYEVELWYACPAGDEGAEIELSFGAAILRSRISQPHASPLIGEKEDRVKRKESYVKQFKRITMGEIKLPQGEGTLALRALNKPGKTVMEFRMLTLKRMP